MPTRLVFRTTADGASSTTERMRITSDGVVLVGQTSFAYGSVGCSMTSTGQLGGTANGDSSLILNRTSSEGTTAQFRYDNNVTAGIAITNGGNILSINGLGSGLGFHKSASTNIVYPFKNNTTSDNVIDLGSSGVRFDDIYATNASIQTSDKNEKQDIEELNDAEKRVAVAAKSLMRKYRWKSAVAEKGENARTHFGIIAQDLQDAFTAEGLDASKYAMFCSNTWFEKEITVDAVEADEENGIEAQDAYTYIDTKEEATEGYTERTRLGVRYNQLLAFIISAI
jgi:ribosomal protein L9